MRWASTVSELPVLDVAVHEACDTVKEQLEGEEPRLLLAFVSPEHADSYSDVPGLLRDRFPEATLVGCSGGGVVGGGHEIENAHAVALTAASLPGVDLVPFHVEGEATKEMVESPQRWVRQLGLRADDRPHFLLMPDPFTSDVRALITSLDAAYPYSSKVGGLASSAERPGENALFLDDGTHSDGAVGVALHGALEVDTIVAQGCRPLGSPMFITRAFRNRILELDGQRPTDVLAELYETLSRRDQQLFRSSLFAGLVMNDGLDEYRHGDFLIRNIAGIDAETGVVAVGELVRDGQVVQFHVRDARAAAAELDQLLRDYRKARGEIPPAGALLFSCQGRGQGLYGEPDHDTRLINERLGPVSIGGFFCNGEIGPVNDRTFLHGYTSSIALFRDRSS